MCVDFSLFSYFLIFLKLYTGHQHPGSIYHLTLNTSIHNISLTLNTSGMAITINLVKPEPGHDEQNHPRINNTETVASYSWLDEPTPTILVPGQS